MKLVEIGYNIVLTSSEKTNGDDALRMHLGPRASGRVSRAAAVTGSWLKDFFFIRF